MNRLEEKNNLQMREGEASEARETTRRCWRERERGRLSLNRFEMGVRKLARILQEKLT